MGTATDCQGINIQGEGSLIHGSQSQKRKGCRRVTAGNKGRDSRGHCTGDVTHGARLCRGLSVRMERKETLCGDMAGGKDTEERECKEKKRGPKL